jgi:hypothetical protein
MLVARAGARGEMRGGRCEGARCEGWHRSAAKDVRMQTWSHSDDWPEVEMQKEGRHGGDAKASDTTQPFQWLEWQLF